MSENFTVLPYLEVHKQTLVFQSFVLFSKYLPDISLADKLSEFFTHSPASRACHHITL